MAPISRILEITVISAEDLRRHRKLMKRNSFATVKFDSQNLGSTQIDDRGGSYPLWNEKMAMSMPSNASFMTVDVFSGSFSRNKIVGTVNVPVSDFLDGFVPERYLHFLSYRLKDVRGERNGIVNISVRVLASDVSSTSQKRKVPVPVPVSLPVPEEKTKLSGGAVAIGIPVCSGHPIS